MFKNSKSPIHNYIQHCLMKHQHCPSQEATRPSADSQLVLLSDSLLYCQTTHKSIINSDHYWVKIFSILTKCHYLFTYYKNLNKIWLKNLKFNTFSSYWRQLITASCILYFVANIKTYTHTHATNWKHKTDSLKTWSKVTLLSCLIPHFIIQ